MDYLEKKRLLEKQGWHIIKIMTNSVTFGNDKAVDLLIELNYNGNDILYSCACPINYLKKHLPRLEEKENEKISS